MIGLLAFLPDDHAERLYVPDAGDLLFLRLFLLAMVVVVVYYYLTHMRRK